ncbi:MAG: hypothetical protein LBD03_04160 [Methanobrevibacter sp.]|nr:hypothetical protein [Candidatus Methanovirga procula]
MVGKSGLWNVQNLKSSFLSGNDLNTLLNTNSDATKRWDDELNNDELDNDESTVCMSLLN